jgi:hypothetical protein
VFASDWFSILKASLFLFSFLENCRFSCLVKILTYGAYLNWGSCFDIFTGEFQYMEKGWLKVQNREIVKKKRFLETSMNVASTSSF